MAVIDNLIVIIVLGGFFYLIYQSIKGTDVSEKTKDVLGKLIGGK